MGRPAVSEPLSAELTLPLPCAEGEAADTAGAGRPLRGVEQLAKRTREGERSYVGLHCRTKWKGSRQQQMV